MATINTTLAEVDELKPNPYSEEVKAGWLAELDGKIAVEVLHQETPVYGPEAWDTPLLVPAPYDNLYALYVSAMIDYYNQELDRYQNSMVVFNAAMDEYRKWYQRTNLPTTAGVFRGYL